jgi:predicted Zn-dependent protease
MKHKKQNLNSTFVSLIIVFISILSGLTGCEDSKNDEVSEEPHQKTQAQTDDTDRVDLSSFFSATKKSQNSATNSNNGEVENEYSSNKEIKSDLYENEDPEDFNPENDDQLNRNSQEYKQAKDEYNRRLEAEIQKTYYNNYFSKSSGSEQGQSSSSLSESDSLGFRSHGNGQHHNMRPARPIDLLPSNNTVAESLNKQREISDSKYSTSDATGDFPPMPPQMYTQ